MNINVRPFFVEPNRRAIFEQAALRLRTVIDSLPEDEDEKQRYVLNFIGAVFYHIKSHPELFDERCLLNIESLGDRFVDGANHLNLSAAADVEIMFSTAYRFLIEYQLGTPNQLPNDLLALIDRVHDFEFDGVTYGQIRYAEHQMLTNILQKYIYHPKMVDLRALPDAIEHAERERRASELDMQQREDRVNDLKSTLDTYKTAFNFVGLYDGFKKLRSAKGLESWLGLCGLIGLGLLMTCPFVVKFYLTFYPAKDVVLDTQFYIALAGFEFVLVYFFRVALHNYRSIKAQLIQIDLRMTLCQFVQDYARYAKEVRQDSPQLLERFDQIVFSGIVNSEGAIPSTFDGLEQIANLIDKFKSR